MSIYLSLLVFMGSAFAKKEGDFGIFSACTIKDSLRLNCHYANCSKSPSFDCEFFTPDGSLLAKASDEMCWFVLPEHHRRYGNKTTNYTCTLTRRKRREQKNITIDYSIRQGKSRIKACPSTTGLPLHPAPSLLWPAAILSLRGVLITDGQTT